MEIILYSSNLFSHPDKKLIVHLQNVSNQAVIKLQNILPNFNHLISAKYLEDFVYIMGFVHDFGKATVFFQEYLLEKDEKKKTQMKNDERTNHSLISAIFAFVIAKEYVEEKRSKNDLFVLMPLFIFLIVKRHHGNVRNITPSNDSDSELNNYDFTRLKEVFTEQIISIDVNEFELLLSSLNEHLSLNISSSELLDSDSLWTELKNISRKEKRGFRKIKKNLDYYVFFLFTYSLLLHSDKEDAIFGTAPSYIQPELDCQAVHKYKRIKFGKPDTEFNLIKEAIFIDSEKTVLKTDLKHRIFSLNVPTGTGKTLTALATALKLREKWTKEKKIVPKIIYALPFTSIIDQNFQVFEEVLGNPKTTTLLKHHHLSEITYQSLNAEFETSESKFLIESWESEITVTTFFQIFHTLFTNRNRMIQKFHKFANAIILIDEVQAIPVKYWKLIRELILKISELLNATFIFITATQPQIFRPEEIVELVPEKNKYFEKMNRINISFHKDQITMGEFKKHCVKSVLNSDESFLFITNTITTSIDLFSVLKELNIECDYFYLSTNIIPKQRLERIDEIKKSKNRRIIVSTQMVEAGVDIDVDNVWRDFAPLDSINQAAGRCNRNFGEKKGCVEIFNIVNENHKNTPFSKYIYGKNTIGINETHNIFDSCLNMSESDFLKYITSYYDAVLERSRLDESERLLEFIKNMQFEDIYKNFHLIDKESYTTKDVFVELDENAVRLWNRFLEIRNISDLFEKKGAFLKIKKDFYDYIISIPEKFVDEEEFENSGIVYINKNMIKCCYNNNTGWVRAEITQTLL